MSEVLYLVAQAFELLLLVGLPLANLRQSDESIGVLPHDVGQIIIQRAVNVVVL